MRGSVFELLGQVVSNPKALEALLELIDTLFSAFIIGPLVMIYWASAWSLMDLYILPDYPFWSAVVTALGGSCIGLLLCVFQDYFSKWLTPKLGWKYYVLTRFYTCVAGFINVGACRGVWKILDETLYDPDVTVLTTVVATLTLMSLRAFRNITSAPYCIVVDSPEGYFDAPTFYKQVCLLKS